MAIRVSPKSATRRESRKNMWVFLLLLSIGCYGIIAEPQQATLELIKAGQDLAYRPIDAHDSNHNSVYNHEIPPNVDDLATSRLRQKILDVIDKIWETLNNQQRFAIILEKGVEKEVLKMYRLLQSDIFSIDQYISRSQIVQKIKTATLSSETLVGTQWRNSWDIFQSLTGKVALYYSYLDGFMSAAASQSQQDRITRLAMEDYAKSIIQPGSTGDTSILKTLDQFHSLISPALPKFKNETHQNLAALLKLRRIMLEKVTIGRRKQNWEKLD